MADLQDEPDRNPIEVIADQYIDRMRRGEQPTVEEYATRYPDLADDIRELLPTVVAMEELKLDKEQTDGSWFLRGPGSLTRLGDFLILGEIGRGGMGIVYEAEQQSLGRHVAVKVLPRQSLLDEHRLARFQREAQTAARLHHTNIVPIFGVGEQDGYHYYVMQFIQGLGLDRILRELRGEKPKLTPSSRSASMCARAQDAAGALRSGRFPAGGTDADVAHEQPTATNGEPPPRPPADVAYWRSVARIGVQVADALSYAHSQGTLHRDIKPANLLLDGQGVVWITDFGLAKAIESSDLTHTGDVVGTLQYMAPEQFCGEYDARSDIYCLGLTLYELLTLQPAVAGDNRSGLIRNVTEGRPPAPRKISRDIPADLETIVLKVISREPGHRYQTANELREDLQRFLEDRPILARRINPAQQLWRWCRRNKPLAGSFGIAIAAVLTATFVGWWSYVNEASISAETRRERDRAKANLTRALTAFGWIFDKVGGPDMFQAVIVDSSTAAADGSDPVSQQSISIQVVSEKDRGLLQKILEFYDDFDRLNQNVPAVKMELAGANHKIGDIHLRLGELDAARNAYIVAIRYYNLQGAEQHAIEIATIRNQLGQVHAKQYLVYTARESHLLVLQALEGADGEPTDDRPRALFELARAHDFLGSWGPQIDATRRGPPRGRDRRRSARRRGFDRRGRGGFRPPRRGRERERDLTNAERARHHVAAQRLIGRLLEANPNNQIFRLTKARSCRNYFGFLWRGRTAVQRQPEDETLARFLLENAIEILDDLASEYPDVPQYRYELAQTLAAARGRPRDLKSLERARGIATDLHLEHPSMPSYAVLLSDLLRRFAEIHIGEGNRTAGMAASKRSIELLEPLVSRWPGHWSFLRKLANSRVPYAVLLERDGNLFAARIQLEFSIEEFTNYLDKTPAGPRHDYRRLAGSYSLLSRVLARLGLHDEAQEARTAGDEAWTKRDQRGR